MGKKRYVAKPPNGEMVTLKEYDYVAVLDFEANCIPSADRAEGKFTKPEHTNVPGFVMEVIEMPTVILRRKREEAKEAEIKTTGDKKKKKWGKKLLQPMK